MARGALRLALVGTVIGLALALGAAPRMEALLFGVSARDPVAFLVPPLVFLLVAWLGSYMPARRASR
ncbi:MAG TPA: hypothetical protein VF178_09855, partial [Gemmatimonadaceae bacterium]